MPRRRRKFMIWIGILFGLYMLWCGALYTMQGRMIFPRHFTGEPMAGVPSEPPVEQIWITGSDGSRVEAWLILGEGVSAESPGPAVIYTHGNAELIEHGLPLARMYRQWGVSVLLPEYRGYGNSGGTPSQKTITEDLVAFHDLIAGRAEIDATRIIMHGRSIGGGCAGALAAQRTPAALILESTFTSVADMTRAFFVPRFLIRNPFRTDLTVAAYGGPVLIMHGVQDGIIPVKHGRRLRDLAQNVSYEEVTAGHNDFPPDWGWYENEVLTFLRGAGLVVGP